jgi:DNA binding domain, excisionase family
VTEALLTSEEVAELLALKPQTVRDAAWRGRLPCVRLWQGKKKSLLRFRRSEIEAFILERSVLAKRDSKN